MKIKFKQLFSFILVFCFIFIGSFETVATISSSDQEKIDEYEKKQEELEQKIEEAEKEIEALKGQIADKEAYCEVLAGQIENYQKQIDVLNKRIGDLEAQKAVIQEKIDTLDAEISKIDSDILNQETQIANTEDEISNIYLELQNSLCEVYVNGATSEIELLFDLDDSDDFSTYLIIMELTQRRAEYDDGLIKKLNEDIRKLDILIAELNIMKDEIVVKRNEQQEKVDELNIKENEIISAKSKLVDSQDELKALQQEAYAYIRELDAQSEAYAKLVESYEADIKAFEAKIDAIINSASHGSGDVFSKPGGFIWPLQYSDVYISSSYGYRYDPISGVYKLHGGTDTCCWSGTYGKSVRAAASGTVIISTWHSAYGYYVGIDHGDGIVTIYAHNSQLNVSVGQTVNQGDIVAYAGSTGYSTGAHCHFEVRLNGNRVDPTSYASLP